MRTEHNTATWIALTASTLSAGCVFAPVDPSEPEPPPALTAHEPVPVSAPAAPVAAAPAPAPVRGTTSPAPPEAKPVPVLLPAQSGTFTGVLPALEAELSARKLVVSPVPLAALDPGGAGLDAGSSGPVVALGTAATQAALRLGLRAPVVFCQVPEFDFDATPHAYGVAHVPPLDLQLKAWRRLAPALRRIALVLGRDETLLAARARDAAEAQGLELELHLASSDQEAVYHFKRAAAGVDGLWLLPDNTVLSPRAIREMLDHAAARNVQTLVFTPSLLEWGALLSVAATDGDLARTLAGVVEALVDGRGGDLPPITPLSELEARVNVLAAERLGLDPRRHVWIERSSVR